MKNKTHWWHGLLIVAIYFAVKYVRPYSLDWIETSLFLRRLIYYSWYTLPVILYLLYWDGWKNILQRIGIRDGMGEGFFFAFLFTLPMLVGFACIGTTNVSSWNLELVIVSALLPGFFEEFYFRGFVFGELFKRAKWSFILAAGFNGLVFGLGHIWQGNSWGETIGIFLVTFGGAAWFAWLYVEWRNNLWLPIGLHILMNLYWALFDIESNALGGVWANVFRGLTIALSIIYTLRKKQPRIIGNG